MGETEIQVRHERVSAVTVDASGALYVATSCFMDGRYVPAIIARFGAEGEEDHLFVDRNAQQYFPDVPNAFIWSVTEISACNGSVIWADESRFVWALKETVASTLITGGAGFGNWDRHEGGDPDTEPPYFGGVNCDRTAHDVVVADPHFGRILCVSLATPGVVDAVSVGVHVPSAVAKAGSSIYFSSLDALYRAEIGYGIRAIAHVGDRVNDHALAIGPHGQLFCGVGESVVSVDRTGRATTLARCSGPVRAIAAGDDEVVFIDDNAIRERRAQRISF
jgi:hypothetical protein